MPRNVAKERGQSRGIANLPDHSREFDRSSSSTTLDLRDRHESSALFTPTGPPRPRSASAITTGHIPLHIAPPALFVLIRISPREPLITLNVSDCASDEHFFDKLRRELPPTGFDRTLEFANFFLDDLIHIRVLGTGKDASPPEDTDQTWEYSPRPMRIVPPVGKEALTDYFCNPQAFHGLKYSREVLQKLPKTHLTVDQLFHRDLRHIWGLDFSYSWLPRVRLLQRAGLSG